jgi:hypothetical protein
VEISNRFGALENLNESLGINSAWDSSKVLEKIKTSAKENLGYHTVKENKPRFGDECSKSIDQWNQAQLQWLQNPRQINGDNLQNLRLETSKTFRNKKKEYLKDKINEFEINNINKNLRKGTNLELIIKDENGNLAGFQSVLNRWKNFFKQVLNVHGIYDVKQMDIHMAEPLVPDPSLVKVEIAMGKLKRYKSLGMDQILAKLIKAGDETLCSEIHKLIHSIWNKKELPQQWKESITVPIHKKGDKTIIINKESLSYQLPTRFYSTFFWPH